MILQKINNITSKLLISFGLIIILLLYSFVKEGDILLNVTNSAFMIGLALIVFAGSLATFFSGSLNILLAGFSKKIRTRLFDRIRIEDRKKEDNENLASNVNIGAINQEEQKEEEKRRLKTSVLVTFPLILGSLLVLFSFLTSFLFF